MKSSPQSSKDRPSARDLVLRHVENTTNRSGPEVVAALNKSLRYFEDLHLAQRDMAQLCYVPTFQQGLYMYVANTGDPEVDAKIERGARSRARADALLVKSEEEYESGRADDIALQLLSVERRKALGHSAVPRQSQTPLQQRMTLDTLRILTQKAASGIFEPLEITVEPVPGSLKKLKSFGIGFPAGPLLTLLIALEFDRRAIWSDAVFLSRADMLPAPLMLFSVISPASDFAWPAGMPTETRIACYLRALALFAQQIGRQAG